MTHTRVTVEHMRDAIALPWRYAVEDDRTRQTWAGQCRTRDEAFACADAYLRGLWRAKDNAARQSEYLRSMHAIAVKHERAFRGYHPPEDDPYAVDPRLLDALERSIWENGPPPQTP